MAIDLVHAPIDEVVVGLVLDRPVGPDAVQAGMYLAARSDRFSRHEIHEPIVTEPGLLIGPGPVRVWLLSEDGGWLVQLQEDRFHANWRRRGSATYPGFSRDGGAMHFALNEFEQFRGYCERIGGVRPNAVSLELSKIDLLIQGKHWKDEADAALLMPVLREVRNNMKSKSANISIQWRDELSDGTTLTVSVLPARLKSETGTFAYRVSFQATAQVTDDLRQRLLHVNSQLNDAFARLIPGADRRFS
jgi:uncharacterized protein (TIGR04255 family)